MECCRNHRSIDANVEEHTLREFPSDSKFGGGGAHVERERGFIVGGKQCVRSLRPAL